MHQTASIMYPEALMGGEAETNDQPGFLDIEADIRNEVANIKKPDQSNLRIQAIKLNLPCGE